MFVLFFVAIANLLVVHPILFIIIVTSNYLLEYFSIKKYKFRLFLYNLIIIPLVLSIYLGIELLLNKFIKSNVEIFSIFISIIFLLILTNLTFKLFFSKTPQIKYIFFAFYNFINLIFFYLLVNLTDLFFINLY